MLNQESILAIAGVCALVLLIGSAGKQIQRVVSFFLRAVMGALGIYCMDLLLPLLHISVGVGINLFNLLVVGILGLPGFGLLYAVSAVKIL